MALNMLPPALPPLLGLKPLLSAPGICVSCFWHVKQAVCKLFCTCMYVYTAASAIYVYTIATVDRYERYDHYCLDLSYLSSVHIAR